MNKGIIFVLLFVLCIQARPAINVGSPIKAIYVDWHLNWNAPQQSVLDAVQSGYNVIIISFFLSSGSATDMAQAWEQLDDATKQSTIQTAHAAGAVVTVSLGGSTDSPYGVDPGALGKTVGAWVQAQYLDGVDFDLENLEQGFTVSGMSAEQTVNWIATVSQSAYNAIGNGAIISHAPQGPYFGPVGATNTWAGTTGGYTGVYKQAADYITFFNVQFYNQGATCYVDYNGLFLESGPSCPVFPNTSVYEIQQAGVPYSKIVVGKPVTTADASNGWVSGSQLSSFFQQAQSQLQWNTGVMGWVWNDPGTCQSWIQSIYSGGGSNSGVTASATFATTASSTSANVATVATATTASSSSSSTGGGNCGGKAAGMYCVSSTQFEWCPQNIIQSCAPGTTCVQSSSNEISCS